VHSYSFAKGFTLLIKCTFIDYEVRIRNLDFKPLVTPEQEARLILVRKGESNEKKHVDVFDVDTVNRQCVGICESISSDQFR